MLIYLKTMQSLIQWENNDSEIKFEQSDINVYGSMYDKHAPVAYSVHNKKFTVIYGKDPDFPFIGIILNHNTIKREVHVLYKDFLLKDPIKISATIKDRYMQNYIHKKYANIIKYIISKMPRVKKLKRLNLKMIDREMTMYLNTYLNDIVDSYQYIFGYEESQIFKAKLVTTPFYVNDNGVIKIYHMDKNVLEPLEYDGANFLSYFTFSY